jgi:chitin disaccharide deacetylase
VAKRLVVNADDLGLAGSVNRGILETLDAGIVRSTSLMVNMPAAADAGSRLQSRTARDVGVGLHFNIVAGRALTPCPSLTRDDGVFLPLAALAFKSMAGAIDPADVDRELTAQLQRAAELLAPAGLRLTHIDSHRHAHCFPVVYHAVVRAAASRGIPHVRHPYEVALIRRPAALAVSGILKFVLRGLPPVDAVEFTGFGAMASRTFEQDVLSLLDRLPDGTTELMVHPGYDSPELGAIDPYRMPRERELRALTSSALRDRIATLGVELAHFATARPA